MRRLLLLAFITSAAGACTSYNPSLPQEPFLCADDDPKCPDGYACVVSGNQNLCMAEGGGSGSGTFQCADDSQLEGASRNDTIATAFPTGVADRPGMTITFDGAAICPATDVDDYGIVLALQQNIEIRVEYDSDGGALQAAILSSDGSVAKSATAVQGATDTIDAVVETAPAGQYYASVFGSGSTENNYKITISITN
jgi:hypothetical protein